MLGQCFHLTLHAGTTPFYKLTNALHNTNNNTNRCGPAFLGQQTKNWEHVEEQYSGYKLQKSVFCVVFTKNKKFCLEKNFFIVLE